MSENIKIAQKLGYISLPEGLLVRVEEAGRLMPNETVMMVTGAQGEPSSVLARMSTGQHRQVGVQKGDTVILSAHAIPATKR